MPRLKGKRRLSGGSDGGGSARKNKRIRFDEEIEEGDDCFLRFAPSEVVEADDASTDEDTAKLPTPKGQLLLPDVPKPWKGHFRGNSLDSSLLSLPFVSLHNEVLEFCSFITPTAQELSARNALLEELTALILSIWPSCKVQVFGSQMTQLLTPTSDMDVAVLDVPVPEFEDTAFLLSQLASQIKQRMRVSYVEAILNAKVPIIKFDHAPTGISVDICINNDSGVKTGEVLIRYLREFPALRPLLSVLKVYLSQRKLNETYTGGVGSFVLACMIVSFLQMRQRNARVHGATRDSAFAQNLGSLLVDFFRLYGVSFNYYATGISLVDGGAYFNKFQRPQPPQTHGQHGNRPGLLSIANPDQPDQDMGKNSFLLPKIRRAFEHTYQLLCCSLREPRDSHLAFVIRGDDEALMLRAQGRPQR